MKKDKMNKEANRQSFEEQKLDVIRMRIKNGYYEKDLVLENVVREIVSKEIKK